jgi:hypothetical protein
MCMSNDVRGVIDMTEYLLYLASNKSITQLETCEEVTQHNGPKVRRSVRCNFNLYSQWYWTIAYFVAGPSVT